MSHVYGARNDEESIATLHKVLDRGINFWDTVNFIVVAKMKNLFP